VGLDGRLFLIGYSQGGHATAAAHRELEARHANEFTVTAAAPMAGALDLSGTALDDALQPGCGRECPVSGFQIGPLQPLKDDYPTVA
jgi:hypothetical protein